MKTILVKAFVANNIGDDLFLQILLSRYPNCKFILIGQKKYTQFLSKHDNVEIIPPPDCRLISRFIIKAIKIIASEKIAEQFKYLIWYTFYKFISKRIDGYLIIGGSMFIEVRANHVSLNDKINLLATRLIKKPKFVIGANFGPYASNSYLDLYKLIFNEFDDVCFREGYSNQLFNNAKNIRYSSDIVFQFEVPKVKKEAKCVGFSIIDLSNRPSLEKHKEEYIKVINQLITYYENSGYTIYLFSFCKAEGDEKAIRIILSSLPDELKTKINIVLYNGKINEFLEKFGKMEIFISTRFHAMILSMLFGQNIYPIIYSNKMRNVLSDINYKGTSLNIDSLSNADINKITNEINNNIIPIESLPKNSENQFLKLDEFLLI